MQRSVEEKIVDYLTVQLIEDKEFTAHPHCRVRTAWIRAKSIYKRMSEEEKLKVVLIINSGDRRFE
tara:strand:+ start:183 stop:380 length:198 start_codon:yes stop_codon:yes gene_type:complete